MRLGNSGQAAIEFGMAGFGFVLFLVFSFETALQLSVGAALDRGARVASRAGALGSLAGNSTAQAQTVGRLVVGAAPGLLVDNRLIVTVQSFPSLGQVTDPKATAGAGTPSQASRYALTYRQPIFSGAAIVRQLTGRDYFEHRAVLVVKNEPAPQT